MSDQKLPKLKDLVSDLADYKRMDELNFLMNQEPPRSWVSKHPIIKKDVVTETGQKIKVPYEYIAIDKVEYLLRKIFKHYKIEVLREGQMFNAVYCCVRVWYKDPLTGEWRFHDGVGASQLQTKKGTGPGDLSNINHGAVMMSLPLAKTLAIKDACDMFGTLFGANLNRQDVLQVNLDKKIYTDEELHQKLADEFKSFDHDISEEDRMNIERILDTKETNSYQKAIQHLLKTRKK